jgi:predicted nucleic acid-binding protein
MKMPSSQISVYDTRFFIEHFYSNDDRILNLTKKELESGPTQKSVSVITLHEFYRLNLERHGRDVALLRTSFVRDSFRPVDVDSAISIRGAELRKKYSIPMGDSLIAATADVLHTSCVTDDPHFEKIREIRTRWII